MLGVGAALAPWSKEVKLSQMLKEFNGDHEFVSEDEMAEIAAAARAENKERFPDGYPDAWKSNGDKKTNRAL